MIFQGKGSLKALYRRPSSHESIYPNGSLDARVYITSPANVSAFRKVIDTLHFRPILLCDIGSDGKISDTIIESADGIICKDSRELDLASLNLLTFVGDDSLPSTFKEREGSIVISCDEKRISLAKDSEVTLQLRGSHSDLPPIIKICGLKTVEAAREAINAGANMLGMIMVPNRDRSVPHDVAKAISNLVKSHRRIDFTDPDKNTSTFEYNSFRIRQPNQGPFLVGVFRNQPLDEVLQLQEKFDLDYVQLHGSEPIEWAKNIPVPVIKRFTPGTPEFSQCLVPGYHVLSLIDSPLGGEGKLVDRSLLDGYAKLGARFVIAGGLNPENVSSVFSTNGVVGVDVSGGVETNGSKDLKKIRDFVHEAKINWN